MARSKKVRAPRDPGMPQDPRMPRNCDVCQGTELSGPHSSDVGLGWTCNRCGAEFDIYVRLDGELFDVPTAWGRCIGVVFEPESVERIAPEDLVNPEIETHDVRGELYYVFAADDGTIRRARMGWGRFDDDRARPTTLPERLKLFHFWSVDIWPPARRAEAGGGG